MKVVITGATGNVGTSVLEALREASEVEEIVGIARRKPSMSYEKTRFVTADVSKDDLTPHFSGADAVIHLAWAIQPLRDAKLLDAVNVQGSRRVFETALATGIGTIVHASSFGTYAPGPKQPVDESWSTAGIPTSIYSRQKSRVEELLDVLQRQQPGLRIVRMRTGLVLKRAAASEMRRYFLGRLLPTWLIDQRFVPVVPDLERLRVQAVHGRDAGRAYRKALLSDAHGAFNIAADPVIDPDVLAELLGARKVRVRPRTLRRLVSVSYRLHLQPSSPGLLDMALQLPLMDVGRAHRELGWRAERTAIEALGELFEGMRTQAGLPTPPLQPSRA